MTTICIRKERIYGTFHIIHWMDITIHILRQNGGEWEMTVKLVDLLEQIQEQNRKIDLLKWQVSDLEKEMTRLRIKEDVIVKELRECRNK